jgi:hypothetical protein
VVKTINIKGRFFNYFYMFAPFVGIWEAAVEALVQPARPSAEKLKFYGEFIEFIGELIGEFIRECIGELIGELIC